MIKFIKKMQLAAAKFGLLDFAIFKIYICAVGILVGAYFAPFWLEYITLVWVVAIVCGLFTIVELIRHTLKP